MRILWMTCVRSYVWHSLSTLHSTRCVYTQRQNPKAKTLFLKSFFIFSFYFNDYYIYGFTFVMPCWFSRAFRIIGFCFFILVGGSMEPKRPTLTRKCKSLQRANPIIYLFFFLQWIGRISQNWLICVHKTATQRYLSNISRFFIHQKNKNCKAPFDIIF